MQYLELTQILCTAIREKIVSNYFIISLSLCFRYRTIDLRAKFVLIYDRRLFVLKYNVLWKKLVNVIFIKRNLKGFELLTVPYPPPLNVPVGTYRIDIWSMNAGRADQSHFQVVSSPFHSRFVVIFVFKLCSFYCCRKIGPYSRIRLPIYKVKC